MPKNYKKSSRSSHSHSHSRSHGHHSHSHHHTHTEHTNTVREAKRPTYTKQNNVIDYMSEDDEIPNQKYICVSFATVTDVMKEEFYQQISDQLNKPMEDVKTIIEEWCKREHPKRGFKVRGAMGSLEQMNKRAEQLRQANANFHIFTCEMGKWLPFDPSPDMLEDENYMEKQLNDLLMGYKQNKVNTKQHYDERKRELMEKAISEGTPEGQQRLVQSKEPTEAVKFKAKQADETIQQLQDRIKELEKTKTLALEQLKYRGESIEMNANANDTINEEDNKDKIHFSVESTPSNTNASDTTMYSHPHSHSHASHIDKMREIQDNARKADFKEIAHVMANKSSGVIPQLPPQSQSQKCDEDVMIPSQIRETYQSNYTQKE